MGVHHRQRKVLGHARSAKVDPAATAWQATTSYLPTANSTVVSEKVIVGSQPLACPKCLIAPTSAVSNATCATTPSAKGCRLLDFLYSSTTTATDTAFGEYAGTVKEIKQWSTEPGASAATAKTVQWYHYDGTGHLRSTWSREISPATLTEYSYDAANRLVGGHPSAGPAGQSTPSMMRKSRSKPSGRATSAFW
ncbi:hypothetical protein [Streptomyces sp. NPDC001492]